MEKRWYVKSRFNTTIVNQFRSTLKVDPIVSELLLQRKISDFDTAKEFFNPDIDGLHDPFLMLNMDSAVKRLEQAITNKQKILLFGDYDVDGTTAVALMFSFLKKYHENIEYYIPDRYKEGYGLSETGINYAITEGVDLLITLDCGIKSIDEITKARNSNIDVIVCDHHTPSTQLPDAIILNPKQENCSYPFKELCGCGVGFKLLQGLVSISDLNETELFSYLDLVAISIGADIVDVTDENRILAYHGLKQLNENPRNAFVELVRLAKREFPLTLTDVIFTIAPRINAAGRLRSGKFAVELMVSMEGEEILELAEEIEEDNSNRRLLDSEMTEKALEMIDNDASFDNRKSTIVYNKNWHKGVVGIVASRLIETHYKPTIVLTKSNGKITGSARSVVGFNIYDALLECENELEQFGGHAFAAGMTLEEEKLNDFRNKFELIVSNRIASEMLVPEQVVDIEIDFNELFTTGEDRVKLPKLKRILMRFEPHGPGNMKPVFLTKNVFSTDVRLLKEKHLKLSLAQPNNDVIVDAIGFGLGDKIDLVAAGLPFDLLYTLEINRWKGKESLQLNIKDIRASVIAV